MGGACGERGRRGTARVLRSQGPRSVLPLPLIVSPRMAAGAACCLVPLASDEGERRWREALARRAAAAHVRAAWRKQRTRTTCGPASLAVCLRALGDAEATEERVLATGDAAGAVEEAAVLRTGVTLAQAAALAQASGLVVHGHTHADSFVRVQDAADAFRAELAIEGRAVCLNYHMGVLGQSPNLRGHLSPLGGLHESTASALVLDVWLEETEPVWAPLEALVASMQEVDDASGKPRGWLVLGMADQ